MPVSDEYYFRWPETAYWQPEKEHLWLIPHKCGSTSFRVSGAKCRKYRGETPKITFLVVRDPLERLISGLNYGPTYISTEMVHAERKTIYPISKQYKGVDPDVVLRLEDSHLWGKELCMLFGYQTWTHQNKGPRRADKIRYSFEDLSDIFEYYADDYDLWERGEQWQSDLRRFNGN